MPSLRRTSAVIAAATGSLVLAVAVSRPIPTPSVRLVPHAFTDEVTGNRVHVKQVSAFDGGVEVLAEAWKGGKRLGLGPGGTFETERFLLYGVREDQAGAAVRRLSVAIAATGNTGSTILPGSVGHTTSVYRPDPSTGATTVDGRAYRDVAGESWATIRSGAGNGHEDTTAEGRAAVIQAAGSSNLYVQLSKAIFHFNTEPTPDGDDVSSVVLSFYVTEKSNAFATAITLTDASTAANNDIADSDYGNVGTTAYSSAVNIDSISTGAYNNWTCNATCIAAINKTGVTKIGMRVELDRANTTPTWTADGVSRINGRFADTADITSDPILTLVHAAGAAPAPARASKLIYIE